MLGFKLNHVNKRGPRNYAMKGTEQFYVQRSHGHSLPFGVLQGSVLGPILFTLYASLLGLIASANGFKYHSCADDTQLYISFKPSSKLSE